ncbi:hypothetical protein [Thalassiella azotivora]
MTIPAGIEPTPGEVVLVIAGRIRQDRLLTCPNGHTVHLRHDLHDHHLTVVDCGSRHCEEEALGPLSHITSAVLGQLESTPAGLKVRDDFPVQTVPTALDLFPEPEDAPGFRPHEPGQSGPSALEEAKRHARAAAESLEHGVLDDATARAHVARAWAAVALVAATVEPLLATDTGNGPEDWSQAVSC